MCEIYTDVDGVYTADPRLVPSARKLARVSFEEMLEMAATGAKVLMLRCVEFSRRYGVPIHVRSSFTDVPGTWVTEEGEQMEQAIVSGVTYALEDAKVTISNLPDQPGVAAKVFTALAKAGVNVDMIIQNVSEKGITDISFTAGKRTLPPSAPRSRHSNPRSPSTASPRTTPWPSSPDRRRHEVASRVAAMCSKRWPRTDQHRNDLNHFHQISS